MMFCFSSRRRHTRFDCDWSSDVCSSDLGDGMNVRDWLYVEDHCDAIWTVLNKGRVGEVYNIGGNNEITNRKITETILREMGKDWDRSVKYVKEDRKSVV